MKTKNFSKAKLRIQTGVVTLFITLLVSLQNIEAAPWNGIEPLKSRRADVERILGKPILGSTENSNILHFKISGGTATVAFVDAKFITAKRLSRDLLGTVLQVILQHENATETPESLELSKKPDFIQERKQSITIYSNNREGIIYTFIDGKLKTTRYTISNRQLGSTKINTIF
jgi:hypothetical protein